MDKEKIMEKDIKTKIDEGYYENQVPFKTKRDFYEVCDCNCPKCDGKIFNDVAYHKHVKDYRRGANNAIKLFKTEILDDVGLLDHPKADKIFSKAWENAHSEGFYQVYIEVDDLSDLFN